MSKESVERIMAKMSFGSLVDGKMCDKKNAIQFDVEDPLRGEPAYSVYEATKDDINVAIESAKLFSQTTRLDKVRRRLILLELADLIDKNRDELSVIESYDTGRTISTVKGWDIENCIATLKFYASLIEIEKGELLQKQAGIITFTSYQPLGVCAAITSWNFALVCMIWKLAPALAAGCPIILKPSERAPLSALYLSGLILNSQLIPNGMVQIVQGAGESVGKHLIESNSIKRISLTGGVKTGEAILAQRKNKLSRVSLELGGKSALVVTENADIKAVTSCAVGASFAQQGQDCCASSLIFVHQDKYEEFKKIFLNKIKEKLVPGSQLEENTTYGPLICSSHKNKLQKDIERGIKEGGVNIADGLIEVPNGNFLAPVVFEGLDVDAEINREELFGPITSLIPFESLSEVASKINSLNYGLYVSIWESNAEKALNFCEQVDVLNCWVNTYGIFNPIIPWGGVNKSGIGADNGIDNYYEHLLRKVYSITSS